jgi:hypothetical protein
MKRNCLLLSAILISVGVSAVRADEASKAAKVEEFLKVSHTEQTLSQAMAMMLNQAKSGMLQKMLDVTPTPEQTKANDELQDKLAAILTRTLSWEKLKPAYVKSSGTPVRTRTRNWTESSRSTNRRRGKRWSRTRLRSWRKLA